MHSHLCPCKQPPLSVSMEYKEGKVKARLRCRLLVLLCIFTTIQRRNMEWSGSQQNKFPSRSSQDSAVSSYRNSYSFQDSQSSGLSQLATQDLFSQNVAAPQSQNEANKPSMYEKWKSRQTMMKRESSIPQGITIGQVSTVPGSTMKSSFSGLSRWDSKSSINSICTTAGVPNNRGKPIDYDERKLMDQLVCTIKDCNNEVKSALIDIMEHLDKRTGFSNEQLAKSMSSFLESIWAHEEVLKKLIKEKNHSDLSELEAKLSKKDSQISNLEEQLTEAKRDESQKHANVIQSEIQSFQSAFMNRLEQFEAIVKGNEEKQSEVLADCFNNIHAQQKQNENLCKALKNGMKDSEKRIGTDISKLLQKIESKMISQNIESCAKIQHFIESHASDVQQIVTSRYIQRQDLDKWAATLENSLRKGFTDLLHSLEQNIKVMVKASKEQSELKKRGQVKSVGTFTDNLPVPQRSNNSIQQRSCEEIARQPDKLSNRNNFCYPLQKSYAIEHNNEYMPTISMQEIQYIPQNSNKNFPPETRKSDPYVQPRFSSVGPNLESREFEDNMVLSNVQQSVQNVAPTNRNIPSENRNGLQVSVPFRMLPFVSPFRKPKQPFSYTKGPSPCAVVLPQKQATGDQENRVGRQIMSPTGTKTKSRKRKKCVYTTKRKSGSKKKCAIEGLTPFSASSQQASNTRSLKSALSLPYSKQLESEPLQYRNQTAMPEKTSLRGQVFKTQTTFKSSRDKGYFDPYSFDELDPQDFSTNSLMKGCKQANLARPQTRSLPSKKNKLGLPSTPKALEASESPQSSPSVSVLSLKFHRKVRTPFKGFSRRVRPQDLSVYRVPSINWQTKMDSISPKTLLSDM
ncbi:hypothetical protein RRG08_065577 [Elysia crispata]|uniref:Uncharacterized protein n=1 Tax=Elysia crispata TaxID=231223 RepID=A0AAE1D1N0_9GAST|nr:hypothetical protein RRG08_065577 [Elysia crispata]